MKIELARIDGAAFRATNEFGNEFVLDGPDEVGGRDLGMRPMQLVLVGLAGCSAVDVLLILQKGRKKIDDLRIIVEATRKDEIPAVFDAVHVRFVASGDFDEKHLKRAVDLSMTKYCSVSKMLAPTVDITHSWEMSPTGPSDAVASS